MNWSESGCKRNRREGNSMKERIKNGILSFLFVLGINHYFFPDNSFGTKSTLNLLLFFFVYGVLVRVHDSHVEKRIQKCSYIFSSVYSIGLCFGKLINDTNRIDGFFTLSGFLWMAVTIASCIFVFGGVSCLLLSRLCGREEKEIPVAAWRNSRCVYFIVWAFILILWLPCYLAYYPGLLEYDMWIQTYQAGGVIPINKFHPPLHTLLWKLCLNTGSAWDIQPITIYSVAQMLILSAVFARIVTFFMKRKVHNGFIIAMICFFALNPVVALFSIAPTKDILFGVFFITAVFEIYRFISDTENYCQKPGNYVWLILNITGCCLFRNNALYVFLLCLPFFVISYRKQWKSALLLFCTPIILFCLINSVIFPAMGIEEGEAKEMLSVPMQQIALASVTHDAELSEETKAEINNYMPYTDMLSSFNPRFADPVKGSFQTEYFTKNKAGFIKLWFSLLLKYPKDYISAFMSLNLAYWYPDAASVDPYSGRKYIETGITQTDVYTFTRDSKIPRLYDLYEKVADYSAFEKIPFIANLFSIATPFWSLVLCAAVLLAQKRNKLVLALLPGFFLWLTYMAGPVSNFRYIFPLFIQYPLLLAISLYGILPQAAE